MYIDSLRGISIELTVRAILLGVVISSHYIPTFIREVQIPEWYRYNYPFAENQRITSLGLSSMMFGAYIFLALSLVVSMLLQCRSACNNGFGSNNYHSEIHIICSFRDSATKRRYFYRSLVRQELVLFFAISLVILLTGSVTNVIKNLVGRPRPDFLSRCVPAGFNPSHPDFTVLPPIPSCTNQLLEHVIEGRRAFPSGHASYTTSVFVFGSIYLYYYLLFPFSHILFSGRLLISLMFTLPAIYCGISRTMDYRHHWDDVVAGTLIGTFFAFLGYLFYYPLQLTSMIDMGVVHPSIIGKDLKFRQGTPACYQYIESSGLSDIVHLPVGLPDMDSNYPDLENGSIAIPSPVPNTPCVKLRSSASVSLDSIGQINSTNTDFPGIITANPVSG